MQRSADAEGSIKRGWLNKKGKLNRSYQHRFFVLWYQEEVWVAGAQVEAECFKLGFLLRSIRLSILPLECSYTHLKRGSLAFF